jgi:hypothetical protein
MSFIYPSAKDAMMTGQLNLLAAPVLGVLVTGNYVASYHHASLADIPSATRVAFSGTLENRSVASGVFNADPAVVLAVQGDVVTAVVLVNFSGTDISSPLVAYLDQSPDLPINPTGGNLILNWDTGSAKIFAI